jgi:very-short-patch-repair endonuclease
MARSDIPDWQRQAARRLRAEMTDAERKLWQALRAHRFRGIGFRRQAPIGPYIVDFACHALKLAIEVDGGQHSGSERDAARDDWMTREGYRVLRFWNNEVLGNLEGVMDRIAREIADAPPPQPFSGAYAAPLARRSPAKPTRGEGVASRPGGRK